MSIKLNQNQLLAIPLVAQGVSGKNVAKKIQVTEETVSRWKKLPEFQAEVNALRDNSLDYYAAVRSSYYQNRKAAILNNDDNTQTPLPLISIEFE